MSLRWFHKLSAAAPLPSSGSDGHWRNLPEGWKGKGPQGSPQIGRTWVRRGKGKMKDFVKLYPHQADFVGAVGKLPEGGGIIAAHGTGTGKTISSIAAFEDLKNSGKAARALVIAPAGLRGNFLEKGVNKFTDSKGMVVTNPDQVVPDDVEYVITSYAAFRNNPDGFLQNYLPDTVIADEFHRAGNPGGKTNKALRRASEVVPRFMGLTASISQNDPSDIAPLMDIATGGKAPEAVRNKKKFKTRYTRKQQMQQRGVFGGKTYEKRMVRQPELEALLGKTVHYLEDLDADKKPAKDVETVEVDMSGDQMKAYRLSMKGIDPKIRAKIAEGLPVEQKEALNIFTKLIRARQVSNSLHTHIPNMTLEQAAEATPKVKRLLDDAQAHIQEAPDAQIIMYSNFVKGGVDVIEAGLKARDIPYGVFSGKGNKGVTEASRQQAVKDYQDGKIKVILITGAGAEGLSLGNTTMVQLADGHYNPERISQAEARGIRAKGLSHRPKEKRRVAVKRYVSIIPKNFWQKITFQKQKEKSVGQWVYTTAAKKERTNKQLREVLSRRAEYNTKQREAEKQEAPASRLFGAS